MIWNGKELKWKEDWEEALLGLLTRADAHAFFDAVKKDHPEHWKKVIGYMTGEIANRAEQQRVRLLLQVRHPFMKEGDLPSFDDIPRYIKRHGMQSWIEFCVLVPRRNVTIGIGKEGGVMIVPLGERPAPETLG